MSNSSITHQAFQLHQNGDLEKAETFYRQAIDDVPDDFQALHLLGVLMLRKEHHQEALNLFLRALPHASLQQMPQGVKDRRQDPVS